ncbi:hypothetical protein ACFV3F_29145 [Streptomyces sp. NPDC059717]
MPAAVRRHRHKGRPAGVDATVKTLTGRLSMYVRELARAHVGLLNGFCP